MSPVAVFRRHSNLNVALHWCLKGRNVGTVGYHPVTGTFCISGIFEMIDDRHDISMRSGTRCLMRSSFMSLHGEGEKRKIDVNTRGKWSSCPGGLSAWLGGRRGHGGDGGCFSVVGPGNSGYVSVHFGGGVTGVLGMNVVLARREKGTFAPIWQVCNTPLIHLGEWAMRR